METGCSVPQRCVSVPPWLHVRWVYTCVTPWMWVSGVHHTDVEHEEARPKERAVNHPKACGWNGSSISCESKCGRWVPSWKHRWIICVSQGAQAFTGHRTVHYSWLCGRQNTESDRDPTDWASVCVHPAECCFAHLLFSVVVAANRAKDRWYLTPFYGISWPIKITDDTIIGPNQIWYPMTLLVGLPKWEAASWAF